MSYFHQHLDSIEQRRIEREIAALRNKLGAARSLRKRERYAKRIQSKKAQLMVLVLCKGQDNEN